MAKKQPRIPANLQPWIDARRKFHLSHEHVQMARELGMKRFGKGRPDAVKSIEETAAAKQAKKAARDGAPRNATAVACAKN